MMDFDDQLRRYFGTADLAIAAPRGARRRDRADAGRSRAGEGPQPPLRFVGADAHARRRARPRVAFKDAEDREAARNFMDLAAQADED